MPDNPKLASLDIPGLNRLWDAIQVVMEQVDRDSDSWLWHSLAVLSADVSLELCRRLNPGRAEREEVVDANAAHASE